MHWQLVLVLGACGGAVLQVVTFSSKVQEWQRARQRALAARRRSLPRLRTFVDPPAFTLVALTRVVLGAIAAGAFQSEVRGPYAAIAVGASAPALLRQLGNLRFIGHVDASEETVSASDASKPPAEPDSQLAGKG
jgi:hypothetical protein